MFGKNKKNQQNCRIYQINFCFTSSISRPILIISARELFTKHDHEIQTATMGGFYFLFGTCGFERFPRSIQCVGCGAFVTILQRYTCKIYSLSPRPEIKKNALIFDVFCLKFLTIIFCVLLFFCD